MADQQKLLQLMSELRQAVARGDLEQDVLQLATRGIQVGGGVTDSILLAGDGNIVMVTQNRAMPTEVSAIDEQVLVAESVEEFCSEQARQRRAVSESPYPGLFAYGLQDAPHFFGREQAVAELMLELKQKRVIWLHGRSGTGKSSFIQAGLLPALLEVGVFAILVRPFDEIPTTALKKELLRRRWSTELDLAKKSMIQFLGELDEHLQGQEIYVFFDQFEEFFIHLAEARQEDFARELADCVADARLPVHFVFSLRSDYFGETVILRERLQPAAHREYVLRSLKPEQARYVIVQPLLRRGISYEESLVDTILNHLGGAEIESPQLQLVCERLFRTLPEGSQQITFQQYKDLGEAKGIINAYLKQALNDQQLIPADQQKAAMYLLTTLVTPDGRRDAKRPSDWYADERIHPWTLAWHADRGNLPAVDGTLSMESIRHLAVADYIMKIGSHVTFQKDELQQLLKEWEQPIRDEYIRKLQNTFVDQVILSLRGARLIHEIQSVDGQLAYELIHDYLITEIQGWLDEDEQKARELRAKLNQAQLDFGQHKLLLEPKELEIISSQLGNPKLRLQESDKHLLLLSAVTHGKGGPWLELSGSDGLSWLRQACQTDEYGVDVRLGAATLLGSVNDEQTFEQLSSGIATEKSSSRKSVLVEMLARYLYHASQFHAVPRQLAWPVFVRQAILRVKDGAAIRSRMRKVASYTAPFCVLLMMTSVMQATSDSAKETPVMFYVLATIFVAILGFFAAYLFAEITTSLLLIMRRWAWLWQAIVLASVGSLLGVFFLYILSGQGAVWFEGGIISLALLLIHRRPGLKAGWYSITVALLSGVLMFGLSRLLVQDTALEELGAALSTGVFASVYAYAASRLE